MPYCCVNGVTIHYEVSGSGFPMVMVHANPFDRRLWLYQIAHFSTFFKVIAVDLRGYGRSDKPAAEIEIATLVEDVVGVCREEKVTEAIVAGCSVGGVIALQLGLDHPEIFKALIVVGCNSEASGAPVFQQRIEGYMRQGVAAYHIQHLKSLVAGDFAESKLGRYLLGFFADTDPTLKPESIGEIFKALQRRNVTARLGELKMPVLAISGELDSARPGVKKMSERISGAVYREIPGAGHACCLEDPAAFDREVLDFLRAHRFLPASKTP
jgi:pimeloyl-ACP methyl ester carboxylesterase